MELISNELRWDQLRAISFHFGFWQLTNCKSRWRPLWRTMWETGLDLQLPVKGSCQNYCVKGSCQNYISLNKLEQLWDYARVLKCRFRHTGQQRRSKICPFERFETSRNFSDWQFKILHLTFETITVLNCTPCQIGRFPGAYKFTNINNGITTFFTEVGEVRDLYDRACLLQYSVMAAWTQIEPHS